MNHFTKNFMLIIAFRVRRNGVIFRRIYRGFSRFIDYEVLLFASLFEERYHSFAQPPSSIFKSSQWSKRVSISSPDKTAIS